MPRTIQSVTFSFPNDNASVQTLLDIFRHSGGTVTRWRLWEGKDGRGNRLAVDMSAPKGASPRWAIETSRRIDTFMGFVATYGVQLI